MKTGLVNSLRLLAAGTFFSLGSMCIAADTRQQLTVNVHHVSLGKGLPHRHVRAIVQDLRGFIWIGTLSGLCRYDGYRVKVFTLLPPDSTVGILSPRENRVDALLLGREGAIWVGTGLGIVPFDPLTERFGRHILLPPDPSGNLWIHPNTLHEDNNGILWIGNRNGLYGYDKARDSLFAFLADEIITSVITDRDGMLWVGTRSRGLKRINQITGQQTAYRHNPWNRNTISSDNITSLHLDRNNILWAGTIKGLNRFNSSTDSFRRYFHDPQNPESIVGNWITSLAEDDDGALWIGTTTGLDLLRPETNSFMHFLSDPENPNTIAENNITCLFKASETVSSFGKRLLWAGFKHSGADALTARTNLFKHVVHNPEYPFTISSYAILSAIEDKSGNLWAGTFGDGLQRISVLPNGSYKTKRYTHDPRNPFSVSGDNISALFQDRAGTLWIGSEAGIDIYDRNRDRIVRYSAQREPRLRAVTAFLEDGRGTLWIGTASGLWRLRHTMSGGEDEIVLFSISKADGGEDFVHALYEDRAGNLWVGTGENGLIQMDPETGVFRAFKNKPEAKPLGPGNTVRSIYEDAAGDLWVEIGGVICRFDKALNVFTPLMPPFISPLFTNDILADDHGNLWLATMNAGLLCVQPATAVFKRFDAKDGFHLKGSLNSLVRNSHGEFIVSATDGIGIFHPRGAPLVLRKSPIYITDLRVSNRPVGVSSVTRLVLPYNENSISLSFSLLDYGETDANFYQYKMRGADESWTSAGTRNEVTYATLQPGDYEFRVRGVNSDGITSEESTPLLIQIMPPWWHTWWFRVVAALSLVAIATGAYRYRIMKLREIDQVRLRIASDLHDEVGSELGGIALMSQRLQKQTDLATPIKQELNAITRAAFHTADTLRDIVWFINPAHDSSEKLFFHMKDLTTRMLGDVHHAFHVSKLANLDAVNLESRRHLYLIFKEILHNVAKHAQATAVEIRAEQKNGVFTLTVHDNGKGIDGMQNTSGMGFQNIAKRAELIGATLEVRGVPGEGTTVECSLKIP